MPVDRVDNITFASQYREHPRIYPLKEICSKVTLVALCAFVTAAAIATRVLSYVKWDDSNVVNLTTYVVFGVAAQGLVETLPEPVMRFLNNFSNRWGLEFIEFIGALHDNLPNNYPIFQIHAFLIASLKAESVARILWAPARGGYLSPHPTIQGDLRLKSSSLLDDESKEATSRWKAFLNLFQGDKRIEFLKMIEGRSDDLKWILGCKTFWGLLSGLLLGAGNYYHEDGYKEAGYICAGYATGFIVHHSVRLLRDYLQERPTRKMTDDMILGEEAQVGFWAGKLQQTLTVAWDLRALVLAALITPKNPLTSVLAGIGLSLIHDTHLRSFQFEKIHPNLIKLPKIFPEKGKFVEYLQTAWKCHNKGLMIFEILSDLFQGLLVLGMFGYIGYTFSQSELPSKAALAGFTGALLSGYVLTKAIYYAYHRNPDNCSRWINQLYYLLVVNNEWAPFLFCYIRKMTQLNNETLDKGDLLTKVLGVAGFTLFGISWGNNRVIQWLLTKREPGLTPPSFVYSFLLAVSFWELCKEAYFEQQK